MNYFNYFTEIEEHFQRARGVQVLLSPVDWALIASWREAGIPLAAVMAGIDQAFEKFASGRRRDKQRPRALAYCAAAVLEAAKVMAAAAVGAPGETPAQRHEEHGDAFSRERIVAYLTQAREAMIEVVPEDVIAALDNLLASAATPPLASLEDIDRVLTVLDEKVFLHLQQAATVEAMVAIRAELEGELAPYRRKLRAEQLALIERQFLQRRLLERARLPRLSLFYMP